MLLLLGLLELLLLLLVILLLSWRLLLLLLQLLLMFDTVEVLYNILKHGCDTEGNPRAFCLSGYVYFGGWGGTYRGSPTLADGFGVAHTSGLSKFDQVIGDVTLLCLKSTTANAAS